MPQCCAFGCNTKPEKGNRLYVLPTGARDVERRKIWIQKINRKNWIPTKYSKLCEAHFTSDQFELNRADGIRKLKPNAIPTIFSHRPTKLGIKPPAERSTIDGITISKRRKQQDSNTSCEEFPTPMQGFPVEDPGNEKGADDMDLHEKVVELTRKLDLARKEQKKLKIKYEKLKQRIGSLFNEDQLNALGKAVKRKSTWSDETIQKALKLRLACGTNGYNLLLDSGYPLPSERTLRRRLENINFCPGILKEMFPSLRQKVQL